MVQTTPLAPDYYLNNFYRLIEHTLTWYDDLLHPQETNWIENFTHLSHDGQCLLVRLYSRKGALFRSDKFKYAEINSIEGALEELAKATLITCSPTLPFTQLADALLTKQELSQLVPSLDRKLKKSEMIAQLAEEEWNQYESLPFTVIALNQPEIGQLLLTLFFANTHQDMTQFVLDDLGLHQFEHYPLSKDRRFFRQRTEIDALLLLGELSQQYWLADRKQVETLQHIMSLIPAKSSHLYIERKRQYLVNDIARDFERLGLYEQALELFNHTTIPPSRERKARIYDKRNELELMSDVVTDILHQPYDISELEIAEKLQQRLLRKQGQKIPRQAKPKYQEILLTLDLSKQRVELAVKEHLESDGWTVYFAENTLLNGLLGLSLWEAIFAPVEGAFINQYQYKPLDLYYSDFVAKRRDIIEPIMTRIAQGDYQLILDNFTAKFGLANPFVVWSHLSPELLNLALNSIPPALLAALIKIQLSDLKLYRNGMPDLIAFQNGQFRWIEVKGPGDKLQDNQLRWIHHFQQLNVPFSVCFVEDSNQSAKKA